MSVDNLDEPLDEDYPEFMDSLDTDGVYLSGPIRCVEDNGIEWREELIEDYPEIEFNNPLDNFSPETHDILNDPADFDEDSEKTQVMPSEYVMEDKIMINESDVLFLGIPDEIARGSMMETMYAYLRGIPFFVWTIDGQQESGWIFDQAEFMSNDRDEVINEVKSCLTTTT
jgi:hypothetical protein